jgi:hypothetical protein
VATYSVLPDTLDLRFVSGDELSVMLDFSENLTGYTFSTSIYEVTQVVNGAVVATATFSRNFTITPVDLATGRLNLSLNETDTGFFSAAITYRWYLRWVAPGVVTRTVVSGTIRASLP